MTRYTLTIFDHQKEALKHALRFDGLEDAALMLCGRAEHRDPWTGEMEHRFIVYEVVPIPAEHIEDRTPTSVTWSTTPFYNLLKRASKKGFAVAAVHTHPSGHLSFSAQDDQEEKGLFAIPFNRDESIKPHLSIIMTPEGGIAARAYGPDLEPKPITMLRTIGRKWSFDYPGRTTFVTPEALDRQARVFTGASIHDLMQLRVGIAGVGGTGSAVALFLARIGVSKLALFDRDRVAHTNLNRLHFSRQYDANLGRLKVDVVAEAIAGLGLSTSIRPFEYAVDEAIVRDAVKSCDVIFGCTDDHLGRSMLNRLAYFFGIPVIDMGVLIQSDDSGTGYEAFDGRVTVVQPGHTCQLCRSLIDPDRARAESLLRNDPAEYLRQRQAGYVPDELEPAPVVVTFTTEVAAMAVNEMFQRLTGFRGLDGSCAERVRRFDDPKPRDMIAGCPSRPGCPICADTRRYDGRGDMIPFLDMAG
ncbi:MAG TPA: ThiF family adenylyltransferase [Allosphingosinicella sp.]|nr:ThiF family adenylyltransferase [Allosphingosinicella sp.]